MDKKLLNQYLSDYRQCVVVGRNKKANDLWRAIEPMIAQEAILSGDLAKDLLDILDDCKEAATQTRAIFDETKLMMQLVSYITRRDHSVWNAGHQKGKENNAYKVSEAPQP